MRINQVMVVLRWISLLALLPALAYAVEPATPPLAIGSEFAATDTLACGDESNAEAKDCLVKLSWPPTKFTVRLEAAQPDHGNYLVRFPSPRPIGDSTNDLVSMEWYPARDTK